MRQHAKYCQQLYWNSPLSSLASLSETRQQDTMRNTLVFTKTQSKLEKQNCSGLQMLSVSRTYALIREYSVTLKVETFQKDLRFLVQICEPNTFFSLKDGEEKNKNKKIQKIEKKPQFSALGTFKMTITTAQFFIVLALKVLYCPPLWTSSIFRGFWALCHIHSKHTLDFYKHQIVNIWASSFFGQLSDLMFHFLTHKIRIYLSVT